MTNHWNDLKNTDCALIMGGNPAENHPLAFRWLLKAREERGAKVLVVDPRVSRSASQADHYCRLRSGTDIAFIGGIFKYVLDNKLYWEEYVANYTNASFIIDDKFSFNDGLFSGYNQEKRTYDPASWAYKLGPDGQPLRDMTLQDPRCVLQLMKQHYSRYDVDTVCKITGADKEDYLKICETYAATGKPDKTGVILYAMGITQHTVGSQNVRAFAMLQLLLGNIGVPGGGVAAMRGESNVQGSTDMALLFHLLPGYVGSPDAKIQHENLAAYNATETPATGYWQNKPKFLVSMLKAWWGDAATRENDFAYHYLPKKDPGRLGGYSHIALFEAMHKGDIKGLFIFGSNPIVGGPNANKEQEALCNLDWMVAIDLWETETSQFWKPEAWAKSGVKARTPKDINTEVFLLPACSSYEKEGTISNSGRWMQYRWKSAEPVGESRSDLEIIDQLTKRIKKQYEGSNDPKDRPILDLTWDYGHGHEPDLMMVATEMNGVDLTTGKRVGTFGALKDDGTTACGIWILAGCYPEGQDYLPKRRSLEDPSGLGQYSNWSWCWPVNRRILYNRCSADLNGKPWDESRKLIWWDPNAVDAATGTAGKWVGYDVPDFGVTTNPSAPGGRNPFIMRAEGVGCLFATGSQMKEGPFPEHYEPWESPVVNLLNSQPFNPVVMVWEPDKQGKKDQYPIIGTTYRVTEHWQAGAMTRNLPWLAELVPNVYVEMSEDLAKEKGIKGGDQVIIESARGSITAYAMVTKRIKPFIINGEKYHQIGVLWHFGHSGFAVGEPANRLTPHIGDGNTMIPEYKAWLCNIRRA
jgi:formate dehydrogenase major subunit